MLRGGFDMSGTQETPREILQGILGQPMADDACEQLRLSPGTTYLTAMMLGCVERALRGSDSAFRTIIELADPVHMEDDEYIDALSQSMFEMMAEELNRQESYENVQDSR